MSIPFLRSFNRQLDRYVGLLNLSPALEAQVRAEQIASILRMTPAMMTGNVIIAIIVISQYLDHPKLPFLIVWAGFVLVMVIAALLAWNRARISPPRRQASSG
ncbi:MAG TPA: hypothetical protein VKN63_09600, partial [Afifellaceae bacterium]|nr:hypothetical protein [Afifellaceae bacterium]